MAPLDRKQLEAGLVELVATESAAEAAQLAAKLRKLGIAAIANAEFVPPDPQRTEHASATDPRSFVLVPKAELDRAWDAIHAAQPREGAATDEEIQAALASGDDGYDDENAGEAAPPLYERVVSAAFQWGARLLLLGCVGAFVWWWWRR